MGRRRLYDSRRLYHIWYDMVRRCSDPRCPNWRYYGGRGIGVCDEWRNDRHAFFAWAQQNGYAENLTIDRRDPDGHYGPGNCRWLTRAEQGRTQRNVKRVTAFAAKKTVSELARDHRCTVPSDLLRERLNRGWLPELAATSPAIRRPRGRRLAAWGRRRPLAEWLDCVGAAASQETIRKRLQYGWTLEDAITVPPRRHKKRIAS
jgi:hypothetical protein